MTKKSCKICSISKDLSGFNKRKDSPDGYRNECKECLAIAKKDNYNKNHEHYLKARKNYYKKNKPQILAKEKQRYLKVKSEHNANSKKYYKKHSVKRQEQIKRYWESLKGRICVWKHSAKSRNIAWHLNDDDFKSIPENCYYTGLKLTFNSNRLNTISLDRKDNTKAHTKDNVVFCCQIINKMKLDNTYSDFINYCHLIANNHPR